jgi:hypothetical protein
MIEFDIIDEADQQFGAILDDRRVTMRLRYNTVSERWSLDLSIDDLPVMVGRRLVVGVDLLEAFNFGIGVMFVLPIETKPDAPPNRENLPDGIVKLYHATDAEVATALGS